MRRPNILVIMTDQQNADAMSNRGNADLSTPHMDRLAREGTRYDRAYTAFPLCNPARASMMTGKWPHQLGTMINNSPLPEAAIARSVGPLMRQAGYRTGWGGKWHVPAVDLGDAAEDFGFENVCGFSDTHLPAACEAFIRQADDRPFLLFASFDNPHNICEHGRDQVLPWGEVETSEDLPLDYPNLPLNHARPAFEARVLADLRKTMPPEQYGFTEERWRRFRHVYFRLVEKVDAQIGQLLAVLDDTGLAEETVVIFLSDHGEHNGAHGLLQKSLSYEESIRVPFIVRAPGQPDGQVSDAMVNTGLDLLPTLLDYAGAKFPEGLTGRSVRPVAQGETPEDWRDAVFVESRIDWTDIELRCLRSERYKYTVYDRGQYREMLFDLEADPGELRNLAVERRYAEVLDAHRRRLFDWCRETGDTFARHSSHDAWPVIPGPGYRGAPPRPTFKVPDQKNRN
ncbi:sulfatase [Marinovum sp.]|uniref:sulfatase family protein n=1 Tax=Marinovum sp. TaxID=2024839 RepID=UPI002B275972|nr:sulfatase-like hydrolase/transferase [Marinovum sp.]